jgi:hypothetical protein
MTVTDPSLKPSDRYCLILSEQLTKDGFILKGKKFERLFEHGKQIIDLSFISNFGLIHGVDFSYHIIFDKAEKTFKKLFGKHWANWTVHDILGNLFRYLYDEYTNTYTDNSLNQAAIPFFKDIYPKVVSLTSRFKTYEQLNFEYNQYPSRTIDIVPSNRFERRILMGLLLTKQFEPDKYEERKQEYLQKFEQFDPFQREQQRQDIYDGIKLLDSVDLNAANISIAKSVAGRK